MKKMKNSILQEFGKDSNTSLKQEHGKPVNKKEKLHFFWCTTPQLYMTCKHCVGISWNSVNFVSRATCVWLFNYFQTFATIEINFFGLKIRERVGNCPFCCPGNEYTNVDLNSWTNNKRKPCNKLFPFNFSFFIFNCTQTTCFIVCKTLLSFR